MAITVTDLLARFSADTSGLEAGYARANQQTTRFTQATNSALGSLQTVGSVALGVAGGGLLALGGGMVAAGVSGLDLNRSMENVTAQLNAFTKDGEKSAQILDMIRERAAKTPFEFNEMAKATAGLLPAAKASGAELESLVEKAEILAASNPAQGLEGAAFALREAVSGDFTSIIERFNLPRSYINKLKEEGVPALEIVSQAMQQVGFDTDLVANLAETADGRWSTFKDTFVGFAATITQPIFDNFSAGLGAMNKWLADNEPLLTQLATAISTTLTGAINGLIDRLPPADVMIQALADGFSQAAQVASDLWAGLNNLWAAIQPVVEWIGQLLAPLVQAVGDFVTWQDVLTALGIAIAAVVIPAIVSLVATITPIIATVAAVIAAVALLRNAWESDWGGIRTYTIGLWNGLKLIFEAIQTWFNATFPEGLSGLLASWAENWTTMQTTFEDVWGVLSEIWTTIQSWFEDTLPSALDSLQSSWSSSWESIKTATNNQWTSIRSTFETARTWLTSTLPTSVTTLHTDWSTGWSNIASATSTHWAAISASFSAMKSWLDATLPGAFSAFSSVAATAWESIRSAIVGKIDAIISTFQSMDNWLSGTLRNALTSFRDLLSGMTLANPFQAMVTALSNLNTALSNAKAVIISWVDWIRNLTIPNPFKSLSLPDWMTNWGGGKSRSGEAVGSTFNLGGSGSTALALPASRSQVDDFAAALRIVLREQPMIVRAEFAVSVTDDPASTAVSYQMARKVGEILNRRAS